MHRSGVGLEGCGLCFASTEFGINRIHLLEGGDLIQTSRLHSLSSTDVMALAFQASLAASRILAHPDGSRDPGPLIND